jgi:phosphoribosylanthranilate isomerase
LLVNSLQKTHIKICCIRSIEEATLAIQSGASAVGLVSQMPSGAGPIPDHLIAEIAPAIPPGIDSFLLTCRQDISAIADQLARFPVTTVQLCDELLVGSFQELRARAEGIRIVQVIHVTGEEAIEKARQVHRFVDGILLDSGAPSEPTKRLGGTGEVHDWAISRLIRDSVEVPIYLAGGLRPDNVTHAIHQVRPYAVDVCTGVRTDDALDRQKVHDFVKSVSIADAA